MKGKGLESLYGNPSLAIFRCLGYLGTRPTRGRLPLNPTRGLQVNEAG